MPTVWSMAMCLCVCVYRYSYDVAGMRDLSEEPRLLHAVEEQLLVGYATSQRLSKADVGICDCMCIHKPPLCCKYHKR